MELEFIPLTKQHFPLLLKWLKLAHIKKWWDPDAVHTIESIRDKYSSYINGYKVEEGVERPISAFIINYEEHAIGYIQIYNAYDFKRTQALIGLPDSLAAVDLFIGDIKYLGKGIGEKILQNFNYGNFEYVFVDPDMNNVAAVKSYEKSGFNKIKEFSNTNQAWMLKSNL